MMTTMQTLNMFPSAHQPQVVHQGGPRLVVTSEPRVVVAMMFAARALSPHGAGHHTAGGGGGVELMRNRMPRGLGLKPSPQAPSPAAPECSTAG